jgi:hypothetical protein
MKSPPLSHLHPRACARDVRVRCGAKARPQLLAHDLPLVLASNQDVFLTPPLDAALQKEPLRRLQNSKKEGGGYDCEGGALRGGPVGGVKEDGAAQGTPPLPIHVKGVEQVVKVLPVLELRGGG